MDQIPLVTSCTTHTVESFWSSVLVYHNRPNLVNRNVAAVAPLLFCEISLNSKLKRTYEIFTWEALIYEIRKLKDFKEITTGFIESVAWAHDKEAKVQAADWTEFEGKTEAIFISIRVLLPRKNPEKCLEIVIFDKANKTATFFAVQEQNSHIIAPRFPYHLHLSLEGNLKILLNKFEDADTSSAEWLAEKLFPKLLKWTEHEQEPLKSLSLVAADDYYTLYSTLKVRYGEDLVKKWPQKAKTDPQKYVFEDIAIASYLICLWRKFRSEKVSFVDCGCGNGLLVYILNEEGYKGCGFDIRRRQVWDLYSEKADLKVGTIVPESVFPTATWIIGNHSDELTLWLPIIALNSNSNFFVIPCCPYDFNGQKYVRKNNALSQYGDYLDYAKRVSDFCGFETFVDKLRIPSTKRTCIVGIVKDLSGEQVKEIQTKIPDLVGCTAFIPRSSVEEVRNCTKLDNDLIKRVVTFVVTELLAERTVIKGTSWNKGGILKLEELGKKVAADDKKLLKNEFGGLQTLLKNHRYIFCVRGGCVSLQAPLSLSESDKYKDKPCWFLLNHPDGCFYDAATCAYKHQ